MDALVLPAAHQQLAPPQRRRPELRLLRAQPARLCRLRGLQLRALLQPARAARVPGLLCACVCVVLLFGFVLFCFVLFCFVLFCFALLCFALLCFALFCFALFCFVLFCFVLFCFVVGVFSSLGALKNTQTLSTNMNVPNSSSTTCIVRRPVQQSRPVH